MLGKQKKKKKKKGNRFSTQGTSQGSICSQYLFSPDSDQLAKVQVILVDLSYEDGCHCFIQGCSIHVDSGSHWKHKSSNLPVNSTVLQETLHSDWQRG